jgi:hypothetical protein
VSTLGSEARILRRASAAVNVCSDSSHFRSSKGDCWLGFWHSTRREYADARAGSALVVTIIGLARTLPAEIASGLDDVSKRSGWNRPAPAAYALPTEIWREVVARRKRYEEVRGKLASGEVHDINDLITHNLDIRNSRRM